MLFLPRDLTFSVNPNSCFENFFSWITILPIAVSSFMMAMLVGMQRRQLLWTAAMSLVIWLKQQFQNQQQLHCLVWDSGLLLDTNVNKTREIVLSTFQVFHEKRLALISWSLFFCYIRFSLYHLIAIFRPVLKSTTGS